MPTLPTVELRGQVARQRGVEIQPGPGAAIGQALQQFGEIMRDMQARQDELTLKTEGAKLENRLKEIEFEVQSEPDFNRRASEFERRSRLYLSERLDGIDSINAKSQLAEFFDLRFQRAQLEFTISNLKRQSEEQVGMVDELEGELLRGARLRSVDAKARELILEQHKRAVDELTKGPTAPRTSEWASNKKQAFERALDLERGHFDLTNKPGGISESTMNAMNYPGLTGNQRTEFIHMAEADANRKRREAEAILKEKQEGENRKFLSLLEQNKLAWPDVENSPYLSTADRKFYLRALTKKTKGGEASNSALALQIEDLLSPNPDIEKRRANAAKAHALSEQGLFNDTLTRGMAISFRRRANDVIHGGDPQDEYWRRSIKEELKATFRFNFKFGMFESPEASTAYWDVMNQLEKEIQSQGLTGEAIVKRGRELAKPRAMNFFTDQVNAPKKEAPPPPPEQHQGQTLYDDTTGRAIKSVKNPTTGKWEWKTFVSPGGEY